MRPQPQTPLLASLARRLGRFRVLPACKTLLFIVLLLLPLHTMLIAKLVPSVTGLPETFMAAWKEALLGIVALAVLTTALRNPESLKLGPAELALLGFLLLVTALALISGNGAAAAYGLRVFTEPLAAYFLARAIGAPLDQITRIAKLLYISAVLIAIWAIFQAAALGDRFLMDIGYETYDGRLHDGFYIALYQFQRAVGTFSSPNTFAIYLQLIMTLGLFMARERLFKSRLAYSLCSLVLLVSLLYSFSRSAILALMMSSFTFLLLNDRPIRVLKITGSLFAVLAALGIVIYAAFPDLVTPLFEHFRNTLDFLDPSTIGHIESLKQGIAFLFANPLGVGVGMSGPKAASWTGTLLNAENSFLVLGFDTGFPGLFLYVAFLLILGITLFNKYQLLPKSTERCFISAILAALIGQVMAWNLLPFIVELECTIPLFIMLGFASGISLDTRGKAH